MKREMNKKYLFTFFYLPIMVGLINNLSAQKMDRARYEGMDAEKVYVSHNTSLLFAGEYLYYSVYCLNDKTKQPSEISTLAYVLLIAEDGSKIFEHKIGLEKSVGQGDFFVSTSVPSGNYKLVAYTKWMRNGDPDLFFQDDITILNPYRADQRVFLDEGIPKSESVAADRKTQVEHDKRFVIETDKKVYAKRAKVTLNVKNFRGPSRFGTYSLSVRRKSDLDIKLERLSSTDFIDLHTKKTEGRLKKYYDIEFLPEEIGERLIGKVVSKEPTSHLENKMVAVSIPGEDFQLKAALTNDEGDFIIDVFENYTEPVAIVQLLESDRNTYELKMMEDPPLVMNDLDFRNFQIDSTLKNEILERSIHNQIENGFYQVRPDTLKTSEPHDPYWGGDVEKYELDDFTRFPTLLETMVEILPYASIRRDGPDNFVFNVRLFENYEGPQQNALVFIDGMLVADYNEIIEFDSKLIKSISILRDKFELAGRRYRGMINIETLTQDYYEVAEGDQLIKVDIGLPNVKKKYFRQNYSVDKESSDQRIPDYRHQLLWEPRIDFNGKEATFECYTSDVTGEYEIVLDGFSIFGKPISLRKTILVE